MNKDRAHEKEKKIRNNYMKDFNRTQDSFWDGKRVTKSKMISLMAYVF